MKKVLSFLVFLVILFSSNFFLLTALTQQAHAQTSSMNDVLFQNTNPDVPRNLQTVTHSLFLSILSEGFCVIIGNDPTKPNGRCLGFDAKNGNISYAQPSGGVLGFMLDTLASTYAIPIHSSSYFSYLSQNFHGNGVSRTYAANANETGIGAKGLDPILSIWIGFRNIAYLLVVIVFIIVGLGIMLRIKIDPRTVMSLQNQIPKIIIGLVLITFSYAIAGLLIDFTYVLTFVFLNVIGAAVGDHNNITNTLFTSVTPFDAVGTAFNPTGGIWGAVGSGATTVGGVVGNLVTNTASGGNIFGIILNFINILVGLVLIIPDIVCGIGAIFGHGCNPFNGIGDIAVLIAWLAILVAVLVALFRFWMSLINAYITILFNVILSPLRILLGGLPGAPGGGVGGFLRDMIANLLIFPVSLSYIYIAGEIAKAISANQSTAFILPMVPGISVGPIIALSAILMLPKIPDAVKEALKSKGALGSAVGQSLAVGAGAAGAGMRKFGQKAWQRENDFQGTRRGIGRTLVLGRKGSWRDMAYNAATQEKTPGGGG